MLWDVSEVDLYRARQHVGGRALEAVDDHLRHELIFPIGVVGAVDVAGGQSVAAVAKLNPGVAIGIVLELVCLAVVEVQLAACLVVLVEVDLEADWVPDARQEGHAALVEQDRDDAAASDEDGLFKVCEGRCLPDAGI